VLLRGVTGMLVAVTRIAGETASLARPGLDNSNWSVNMSEPMAKLIQ
jgi:ABC-type phosphate transport system permease subunit